MNTAFEEVRDRGVAVFRIDGGQRVGGGHIARCDTLALHLRDLGWRIRFAMTRAASENHPTRRTAMAELTLTLDEHEDVFEEAAEMRAAVPEGCDLLVVDHYGRAAAFESACRPWARRILAIDDLPTRTHDCDILLDQTFGRRADEYDEFLRPDAVRLCGSSYALLRDEFATARRAQGVAGRVAGQQASRILVSMGATDPDNATSVVLDGIQKSGIDADIDVVLGQSAPHANHVQAQADRMENAVTVHMGARNQAELIAAADLAIGAGGVSAWERCCLGLPTILVALFDNQRDVAAQLSRAGAVRVIEPDDFDAVSIGQAVAELANDPDARTEMSRRARLIADGLGVRRAGLAIAPQLTRAGDPVRLRPALMSDADCMFEWQCHPETRRYFRSSEIPTIDTHRQWLTARLADPDCILNLILWQETPAGVVRLDPADQSEETSRAYEISILVAPGHKKRGIGLAALNAARRLMPEATFHAQVAGENTASVALFEAAGYRSTQNGWFVSPGAGA